MKSIKLLFLFITLFTSQLQAAVSTVTGSISGGENQKLMFEEYIEGGFKKVDSTLLNKTGKYSFKVEHSTISYYRISLSGYNYVALIIKPGEKITINAKASDLGRSYTVKGSVFSVQLKEFSELVSKYTVERDTISKRFKRAIIADKQDESEKLGKDLSKAYDNFVTARNAFIDKYPNSPATYAVVSHLNFNQDYDLLKKIEKALQASMPESFFYKQVANQTRRIEEVKANEEARIKEAERQKKLKENVAPGKPAPDIIMADSNGVSKSLSSLKGNVVLLDFWASWCGPCRGENPNVVRMYDKYKNKGFTVFSVSLDNDKRKWLTAVKKDNLSWPNHVSELRGWQTSILPIYGITSIPFTVLLDKEGNIIGTGLRGPTLEAKLKEIFGY